MPATLTVGDQSATINNLVWTSDDAAFAAMLNAMLDPLGPSGADPNPDVSAAQEAAERLGGHVSSGGDDDPESVEGRIY